MDLVHDKGSTDRVHESGPWTRSKEEVHGPLVHVLSSPISPGVEPIKYSAAFLRIRQESQGSGLINGDFYAQTSKTILGYT